jgi:hypothetical protein
MPVLVQNTGTVVAVSGYRYQDSRITYTLATGGTGVVSADKVDWNATTRGNNQRGVRVTPPGRTSECRNTRFVEKKPGLFGPEFGAGPDRCFFAFVGQKRSGPFQSIDTRAF